jgi:hypothetical protein
MPEPQPNEVTGNGKVQKMADPFKLERTLLGVAQGYMEIAERVVNNELDTNQAKEATRALNGVPSIVKAQLEAIRIFEKGSQKSKEEAAKILGITVPAIADQSQPKSK